MSQHADPQPNIGDYDQTCRDFSWSFWEQRFSFSSTGKVNYAYEAVDRQAENGRREMLAVVLRRADGSIERITYGELAGRTAAVAAYLRRAGLAPGDRFALYAPRSIEYVIVFYAAIKCGAIIVPLFDAFGKDAVVSRLIDSGASWLYTNGQLAAHVDFAAAPSLGHILSSGAIAGPDTVTVHLLAEALCAAPDHVIAFGDLDTPFIIHYTSGSTGKPKGILYAQRAMIGHAATSYYTHDIHPGDKFWCTADPGWMVGTVYNLLGPLLLGATIHIFEGPFDARAWVAFIERMEIAIWHTNPTALRLLRYYDLKLPRTLRHIVSGGEALNGSLVDWAQQTIGISIHDAWCATEHGQLLVSNFRGVPIKKGSMGKPLPGARIAIIGEDGAELPPGVRGRLAARAPWPGLMKAIWNDPARYERYFDGPWFVSGDIAYRDADGYYWFQGREDDMIKTAAALVSPFEVESALMAHPRVAEAAVIGKPHDLYGTVIKAFVLPRPGTIADDALRAELMRHVRETLAAYEAPREIEFVHELPKTRTGKIMRRVLRARAAGEDAGDLSMLDTHMNPVREE